MAENSNIQWTDNTVNFWVGCKKVSEGCKYCYMFRDMEKYGQTPANIRRTSDKTFYQALKWNDPKKIFTNSWSDFFIQEADLWRDDAWKVIRDTPHHTWQILTKRPERIEDSLPHDYYEDEEHKITRYRNTIIGVSIENNKNLDRLQYLLDFPAINQNLFVSFEPLLEDVSEQLDKMLSSFSWDVGQEFLEEWFWFIVGGESGNETGKYLYRPCELQWIRNLVEVAKKYNIPVFVKQLGTHIAKQMKLKHNHGGDILTFPKELQVREFPTVERKEEE